MGYDVFLICLTGGQNLLDTIKDLWPIHFELTERGEASLPAGAGELVFVAATRDNGILGPRDVYDRIKQEVGDSFRCVVLTVDDRSSYAGFHRNSLWRWLKKVMAD